MDKREPTHNSQIWRLTEINVHYKPQPIVAQNRQIKQEKETQQVSMACKKVNKGELSFRT